MEPKLKLLRQQNLLPTPLPPLTPEPLLRFADVGPAWVGGGAYGIEGGAACTLALVLVTLFTWRTGLLKADPELKRYSDGENPLAANETPT